jgi:hypothetical protein
MEARTTANLTISVSAIFAILSSVGLSIGLNGILTRRIVREELVQIKSLMHSAAISEAEKLGLLDRVQTLERVAMYTLNEQKNLKGEIAFMKQERN